MKTVNEIMLFIQSLSHAERERLLRLLKSLYGMKDEEYND
jgi:hypothetical protein